MPPRRDRECYPTITALSASTIVPSGRCVRRDGFMAGLSRCWPITCPAETARIGLVEGVYARIKTLHAAAGISLVSWPGCRPLIQIAHFASADRAGTWETQFDSRAGSIASPGCLA